MIYARTTAPALPFPSLRIRTVSPMPSLFRAMAAAMRAVDLDIERMGAVTYETVEQVRNTRALMGTI
jgi:hypothetical protein